MTNPNDPAYPIKEHLTSDAAGLTKREAFAMAAMQGLCSNPNYTAVTTAAKRSTGSVLAQVANDANRLADALIAELSK